nr:glycerophosphodiester phosphodiesterase [Halorubrum amylolyticum]
MGGFHRLLRPARASATPSRVDGARGLGRTGRFRAVDATASFPLARSMNGFPRSAATGPCRRTLLFGTAGALTVGVVASNLTPVADGGTGPATDGSPPDPTGSPTLIAHRGFAGENPENTRAAARDATRSDGPGRRADLVEVDAVPTADGDVVAFHDDALAGRDGPGLTDAEGVVWETGTEAVTGAEVLHSGETVPLLGDLLDAVPTDVGVNIELKNPGSSALRFAEKLSGDALETQKSIWRPFVERVLDIAADRDHEFLVSAFYEAALAVTVDESEHPVAPILWRSIEDGIAIARAHDADAIHPPIEMIRGTPFFDESRYGDADLVDVARAEGRDVNVWTAKSWHEAERLAAAGVDGLIADYSTLS